MVLNQLTIAPVIINSAFILLVTALALAFALSFGLGDCDFASNLLNKISLGEKEKKKSKYANNISILNQKPGSISVKRGQLSVLSAVTH